MQRYNPKELEPKWQAKWAADKLYEAKDNSPEPKRYILEYFPYPSGVAMHVGHVRNYTIGDALARHARMNGYNVLHPMGWDAFGLPAENYAIKTKISPKEAIKQNTTRFKQQLMQMGFGYDWSREFASSDPEYYRWTQWFFLLLWRKGLAYQKDSLQWWCPVDKTVLANEQVENGKCWRCGSIVEKKALKQWFFKITDYADRLEKDLDSIDWSLSIKTMQRNWIGHKTGININYQIINAKTPAEIVCFTTRPDTNYGATFIVLAPEHPLVGQMMRQELVPNDGTSHWQAIEHYVQKALGKSELERKEEGRLKTGVFTGFYVLNPLNDRKLPVWVSDFVLAGVGTGAVVGVPGHDQRDFAFAQQFDLAIERVVVGSDGDTSPITTLEQVQEEVGTMINSGPLDGLDIHTATEKMKDLMEEQGMGKRTHTYSLRDWLISRQRYWGAPIPMIHCPTCGVVPVPEDQLPVLLPDIESFEPSGDGRSPLARVESFVKTTCPKCKGLAERETDTMDGFACSSWYFLRFADSHNTSQPFAKDKAAYWLPVDMYVGGAEHAVMHLLYARMWTKVMHDQGMIDFSEPFVSLRNNGMILAPDGQKMSKSKNNTIEPDGIIEQGYGADAIRVMELFIGPWNQSANWSVEGMGGAFRFLQRSWVLVQEFNNQSTGETNDQTAMAELKRAMHRTIKAVSEDLKDLGFNTSIASLMEYVNELYRLKQASGYMPSADWKAALEALLQLLAPFAPHITEELWQQLGHSESIHLSQWPSYDEQLLIAAQKTIVVQINGKVRAQLIVDQAADEAAVTAAATANERTKPYLDKQTIKKTVYVPDKLINFVV